MNKRRWEWMMDYCKKRGLPPAQSWAWNMAAHAFSRNTINNSNILCGMNETCFERGKCWGHYAGVMCKHLSEEKNYKHFFCKKIKKHIDNSNIYFTQQNK